MPSPPSGDARPELASLEAEYQQPADELERRLARWLLRGRMFGGCGSVPPVCVSRYELRAKRGEGGAGIVFEGYDPQLARKVAIKVLRQQADECDRRGDRRLLDEARSVARLVHPNVVTIYDIGVHEGRVFVAMELIDGTTLREWLERDPPWPLVAAAFAQAGRGLMAAHAQGIVHRDFKPDNVILGYDGRVCVADFGLATGAVKGFDGELVQPSVSVIQAATTRSGDIVGTPAYMSPEQYLGGTLDHRADQFSFCVALFEGIFGRRPFAAKSLAELRTQIMQAPVSFPSSPPTVAQEILDAVARGLSKNRLDRFDSLEPVVRPLEQAGAGVDLRLLLADVQQTIQMPKRTSLLRTYLEGLPAGVDSFPQHTVVARHAQLALADHPLQPPPTSLREVLGALAQCPAEIPLVHLRCITAAIYDLYFASLEEYREFVAGQCRRLIEESSDRLGLHPPGSAAFLAVLGRAYEWLVPGSRVEIVPRGSTGADFVFDHEASLMHGPARVTTSEAVRAGLLAAGCAVAEVEVVEATETATRVEARWG